MTTTTVPSFANPLNSLLEETRAKEAKEAADAAVQAEQRRIEREAAEMQRRAQVKQQHFNRQVRSFAEGFLLSIKKHAKKRNWRADAIEQADNYATALLCGSDKELPTINVGIMEVVRNKFAFGLALNEVNLPLIFERQYFVGMRQDWFPALLEQSREHAKRMPETRRR